MLDTSEQMTDSASGLELEPLTQFPAEDSPRWRKSKTYLPFISSRSLKDAFLDAYDDFRSIKRHRQRFRLVKWLRVGRGFLIITWNLTLLTLLICLALLPSLPSYDENPCQANGQFHLDPDKSYVKFNYWAASAFFEITLGWGRFNFATAKMIDMTWDLWYGFNALGGNQTTSGRNYTVFRGQQIPGPPLKISAFYLPDFPFYWNWTNLDHIEDPNPYKDPSKMKYQWGFSSIQFFVMITLLQLWSFGLIIMWYNAHRTIRLNYHATASQGWKGLLEFTDTIKLQLQAANIDPKSLQDEQLEGEIQQLLQGGAISSQPFSERSFSIWRWMWKAKVSILKVMFFIVFITLEHMFRFHGAPHSLQDCHPAIFGHGPSLTEAIMFSILYWIHSRTNHICERDPSVIPSADNQEQRMTGRIENTPTSGRSTAMGR
ncbi:hypothetical protein FSARC_5961 [Fusarium sarcochroum]|uniref:Uncharacterized protein n=1 Tax=Fusarium sarcochroum TaxID=1208366 RepID=A0A8H4X8Y5_9HYPO|nr:hypothetical protein FSARC_5961 [Fusarium sarcochroum]